MRALVLGKVILLALKGGENWRSAVEYFTETRRVTLHEGSYENAPEMSTFLNICVQ